MFTLQKNIEVSLGNLDEFYFTEDIKKEVLEFYKIEDFFIEKSESSFVRRFYSFSNKRKSKSRFV